MRQSLKQMLLNRWKHTLRHRQHVHSPWASFSRSSASTFSRPGLVGCFLSALISSQISNLKVAEIPVLSSLSFCCIVWPPKAMSNELSPPTALGNPCVFWLLQTPWSDYLYVAGDQAGESEVCCAVYPPSAVGHTTCPCHSWVEYSWSSYCWTDK